MGKHAVGVFEGFVGDAAPVRGRTVVGLGIALGLVVGLGTWMLSDSPTRRQPLSMAQPANLPPPDVMAPTLELPDVSGSEGVGMAPTTPPAERDDYQPPAAKEPVGRPSTPPPASRPAEVAVTLTARYVTRQAWNVGFVADIHVTNKASAAQSFAVRLGLPRGVQLTNQIWNAVADRYTGTVTFRGAVPAGQTLIFGFVADKSPYAGYPRSFEPTTCTVNGKPCEGFSSRQQDSYPYSPWWQTGMWRYS